MAAAEQLDRPEPLVLAGAMVHTRDVVADRDPTILARPDAEPEIMRAPPGTVIDGIRVIPDAQDPAVVDAPLAHLVPDGDGDPDGADDVEAEGPSRRQRRQGRRAAKAEAKTVAAAAAASAQAAAVPVGPDPITRRRRRWPLVTLAVVVVLALAAGGTGWWYEARTPLHRVPSLVGTNRAALTTAIGHDGWVVHETQVARAGTTAGQILSQSPLAGTKLESGKLLSLLVSTGPPPVPVPSSQTLAGMPLVQATATLQADQLAVGALTSTYDEAQPNGVVLGLAPGVPAQLPMGSAVPLIVSKGPKPRVVPPGLVGGTAAAATTNLQDLGLKVVQNPQPSTSVAAGLVMSVAPGSGSTIPKGSTVTLTVSSGPPTVVIPPSLVGMSVSAAVAALQNLGLTVSGTQGNPVGTVTGTTPGVGTTVNVGSSVVLVTQ